ncbi:hypothetical protein Pyn_11305 [Prunus yedoensis var. nudiflora]|uniref:Uncharacterized protein n=1 Tax=Prunus yedoensis var. nudiflora TaxID=2094558 RepID=A0A314ZTG6_PRUYE|nr:hypothetical protein Pyn_11305 [Prunus yedoensis var. nudiflora]
MIGLPTVWAYYGYSAWHRTRRKKTHTNNLYAIVCQYIIVPIGSAAPKQTLPSSVACPAPNTGMQPNIPQLGQDAPPLLFRIS